jgi:hypothetical protein
MKTKFTGLELIAKGFDIITNEDGTLYLEHIFDSANYATSDFLSTNDVDDDTLFGNNLSVTKGVHIEDADLFLTEEEIDLLIKNNRV